MPQDSVEYFSTVQANPGWRAILESFARFVDPTASARLLDVGCGPGALVDIFRQDYQIAAYGTDAEPGMLHQASAHYGDFFTAGCLPQLPYPAGSFDLITATNVIYLVDNPAAALHEVNRLLKPGGVFAMLNPSEKMTVAAATSLAEGRGLTGFARENFIYWGEVAEANPRWTEAEISDLFRQAIFDLVDCRTRIGEGLARYAKGKKR